MSSLLIRKISPELKASLHQVAAAHQRSTEGARKNRLSRNLARAKYSSTAFCRDYDCAVRLPKRRRSGYSRA